MRIPERLQSLVDEGIIDGVQRQLRSGKEAEVYIVASGDEVRCAKVYKRAESRSFRKAAEYREGRKTRGSRDGRAASRGGRRGRKVLETEWSNAEVDALYRLERAGVQVPEPFGVFDGVLIMELVTDADGQVAPQLQDLNIGAEEARELHAFLIGEIVRMLCAGIIHGDLSGYNILLAERGPVIIDLPQAVDAAGNNNAFRMLQRDVDNLRALFGRSAPELLKSQYAYEIWQHYELGTLTPESALTGRFTFSDRGADVDAVLEQIAAARREAEARERGRQEAAQAD